MLRRPGAMSTAATRNRAAVKAIGEASLRASLASGKAAPQIRQVAQRAMTA
jgi:hypothetical protein